MSGWSTPRNTGPDGWQTAYIGLGSNQGDRMAQLAEAWFLLSGIAGINIAALSSVWESEPDGMPAGARDFLNAVISVKTVLSPRDLLTTCLGAERMMGRDRSWIIADRPIDLDLLHIEGIEVRERDLVIPHPRAHVRTFVLLPWMEVAPGLMLYGAPLPEWLALIPPGERQRCDKVAAFPQYG